MTPARSRALLCISIKVCFLGGCKILKKRRTPSPCDSFTTSIQTASRIGSRSCRTHRWLSGTAFSTRARLRTITPISTLADRMAFCQCLSALRINPAETPHFRQAVKDGTLTVQIYGGSGAQPLFPVPVSVETDPVLNRASWIKPPYVPEIGQPPPITRISIVAGKHSRNGTEVDVPLTITNTGTVDASSIEFSQIALRVLDGSGQVTLAAPVLPIKTGRLSRGASLTIRLRLIVPSTVKRLAITENGAVHSNGDAPHRFSFGQAIFP